MALLKVANVYFNASGTSRIEYFNDNVIRTNANCFVLPVGTTDNRPANTVSGMIRYNTTTGTFEGYNASAWGAIGGVVDLSGPFDRANLAYTFAANTAQLTANGAFDRANLAYTFAANTAQLTANTAYAKANAANIIADNAFTRANLAYTFAANTAQLTANTAYAKANAANIIAVAAFAKANIGGLTIVNNITTDGTYYIAFSDSTSGSKTILNVASSKLTFNPSTGTLSATVVNSLSDVHKKYGITTVFNSMDIVKNLRGVEFYWTDNGLKSSGVIAQEVQTQLPHLVGEDNSVNYHGIVAYLIESIKELNEKVEHLEHIINGK